MILFLDIDGVLLPGRAYYMPQQSAPLVSQFDPCVVGMVNRLCKELGAKIVVHSSWRKTGFMQTVQGVLGIREHFISQGLLEEYFHADFLCPMKMTSSRWWDINAWLADHPEVGPKAFWILEDEKPPHDFEHAERVVQCDFDEGLTMDLFMWVLNQHRPGLGSLILPMGY